MKNAAHSTYTHNLTLYCVWVGYVLCRFDFFLICLLPIVVKIPLMSHSSLSFIHTHTNCDRSQKHIKFFTSRLRLLVESARSTDSGRCLWQKIVGTAPSLSLGLSVNSPKVGTHPRPVTEVKLVSSKCLEQSRSCSFGVHNFLVAGSDPVHVHQPRLPSTAIFGKGVT